MNTRQTSPPEPLTTINPSAPNVIGISIEMPKMLALLPAPTPPNNYVGTFLLSEAILATLAGAGILVDAPPACGGQLNDSIFMFKVTDRGRAFHLIQSLLRKCGLLHNSAAGYLSPDGVWIMAWPEDYPPEKFYARHSPEWVSEEIHRYLRWLEESRAAAVALINQIIPLVDDTQRAGLELTRNAWDPLIAQLKSESGGSPQT